MKYFILYVIAFLDTGETYKSLDKKKWNVIYNSDDNKVKISYVDFIYQLVVVCFVCGRSHI